VGRARVRRAAVAAVLVAGGTFLSAVPGQAAPTVCPAPAVELVNGGFEEPTISEGFPTTTDADNVPGWDTTAPDDNLELWHAGYNGVPAAEGTQFAELAANFAATMSQTIATTPGTELTYVARHRGRDGVDVADLELGPAGGSANRVVEMSDGDDAWGTYVGSYLVPAGQTSTTLAFTPVSTSSGNPSMGNFLDGISLGTAGCVTVDKSVTDLAGRPVDAVQVGDTVEFTLDVANPGGAAIAGPRVLDPIPPELGYVPGSVQVLSGPNPGPRTDADDGDGVTVAGNRLTVDVATGGPATIPAGQSARIAFRATVLDAAAGRTVLNVATVDYVEPRLQAERTAVSDDAVIRVLASEPTPRPSPTPTGAPSTPPATPTASPTEAPSTSTGIAAPPAGPTSSPAPGANSGSAGGDVPSAAVPALAASGADGVSAAWWGLALVVVGAALVLVARRVGRR